MLVPARWIFCYFYVDYGVVMVTENNNSVFVK